MLAKAKHGHASFSASIAPHGRMKRLKVSEAGLDPEAVKELKQ